MYLTQDAKIGTSILFYSARKNLVENQSWYFDSESNEIQKTKEILSRKSFNFLNSCGGDVCVSACYELAIKLSPRVGF